MDIDMDGNSEQQHPFRRSSEADKRPREEETDHLTKFRRHNSQPVFRQGPVSPMPLEQNSCILPVLPNKGADSFKRISGATVSLTASKFLVSVP
jgi:hypothetical protein